MSTLKNNELQADLSSLEELAQQYELTEGNLLNLLPSLGLPLDELDSALDPGQLALLRELLSLIYKDSSLPEFLDNLDEAGFLYECTGCKSLYLSSTFLLDEESLTHLCQEHVGYSKTFGRFKLIATGSADRLLLWAHSKKLGLDRPFAGP